MGKYVDMVRQRAIQKRQELEQNPAATQEQLEDMAIAEKFLRHPKGFAVSQPIMSLVVLKFLGYSEVEIKDLYYKLVYEQSTEGLYHYVDPDAVEAACSGEKKQTAHTADEKPKSEPKAEPKKESSLKQPEPTRAVKPESRTPKMGRLVYREGGKRCETDLVPLDPGHETYYYTKYCFGKKDENGSLHTLIGNEWRYGGPFRSYYFDAQYDYWEVDYILELDNDMK